jgi:hypothetical protein
MIVKHLELLPISEENRAVVTALFLQYRRFGKIEIRIVKVKKTYSVLSIDQKEGYVNDTVLSDEQLKTDVKAIFKGMLPENYELHTHIVKGNIDEVSAINHEWLNMKINENNIKARQLANMLNVDKTNLSSLLSGAREMTAWHKAAFYYFFKNLEKA